jgi:hypothetical protein
VTSGNWLALFMLGVVGVTVYGILTRPEISLEEIEEMEEDWWS